MMDILMIAHFTQVPGEEGNGRFHYIAERLVKENVNVEVVTTNFSHRTKKHRKVSQTQIGDLGYKLTMLHEPGYEKNVSIKRLYSHYVMGRSLKKYLNERSKPDLIYCAIPSLDVAAIAAKYAKDNQIRFIIDTQDLWPEAFKMVFNVPVLSDVLFYPMLKRANAVYSAADEIIAVSQTYVDRAISVNKNVEKGASVYLGTDLSLFDYLAKENEFIEKPENEIWIAYIGTLGHSYDLPSVIDAMRILNDKGVFNIKLIAMGDGPLRTKFEEYAVDNNVHVAFTGRLDYGKMVGILTMCDIAVNPIRAGSAGSIINKVGDYAAAGLPVINTQQCQEYRDLLDKYEAGINCDNAVDMAEIIVKFYKDKHYRMTMGQNSRKLAEDKFDREVTYKKILDLIAQLSNTKSINIPEDTHDS